MMTEFGGAVAVPSAVRSSDNTTTMRVNDVIMIRIEGAIDSTVNSAISWIARSVTPPLPWPRLMLMSWAAAGPARVPAAIRVARNKTLRGEAASLTKDSLDVRAGTPSRLQGCRTRSLTAARPVEVSAARCARPGGPPAAQVRREGRPCHRPDGEALPPDVAPSRRDFDPPPTAEGTVTAGVVAVRRGALRAPSAWVVRSCAAGAESRARCATFAASLRGEARHGRPTARA